MFRSVDKRGNVQYESSKIAIACMDRSTCLQIRKHMYGNLACATETFFDLVGKYSRTIQQVCFDII